MLRSYQQDALNWLLKQTHDSVYQAPTGTGKSVVITELIKYLLLLNKKVLVITPRKELCENLHDYFPNALLAFSGEQPSYYDLAHGNTLITTYQSASKFVRRFRPDYIFSDECHGCLAPTWLNVIKQFKKENPNIIHLGFTATPGERLDGKALKTVFKHLYTSPSTGWFIQEGYLSDFEIRAFEAPRFESKTDDLDVQAKTFQVLIPTAVDRWLETASDCKTLVFVPTIDYGTQLLNEFFNVGIDARFVHSKSSSSERDGIIQKFSDGEFQVLINVELFTEGVNCPNIDCLMQLRFTYSLKLYLQMVGRLLRKSERQKKLFLDFVNLANYHGAPDFPFHWTLEKSSNRGKSNQDITYGKCENCGQAIYQKQHILCYTEVCCVNCHHVNVALPKEDPIKKTKAFVDLSKLIPVESLELIENTKITWLSRILFQKGSQSHKMKAILNMEDLPIEIKRIGLSHLGLSSRQISHYLDD